MYLVQVLKYANEDLKRSAVFVRTCLGSLVHCFVLLTRMLDIVLEKKSKFSQVENLSLAELTKRRYIGRSKGTKRVNNVIYEVQQAIPNC